MADELSVKLYAKLVNGGLERTFSPSRFSVTQTAIGSIWTTVSIGFAAEEDIATTEIGTLGWCFLRNLDDTNYVTYGPKSGGVMVALGRIEAEECAAFRLEPGITIRAQANTAAVELDVMVLED